MRVLIIGNNVAGTNTAKAIRDSDPNAEIVLFSDENMPYYPRPKLIDFLENKVGEKDIQFYQPEWYEKNKLDLRLGHKVEKIDRAGRKILVKGIWHQYDKLVIASGCNAFVPPLKGLPKRNVFTLRTIEDAKRIKEAAAGCRHSIVIGGGLLGLEAARGVCTGFPHLNVTILEYAEHLLMRQLDHEGAMILQKWIENTGAKVLTEAETEEVLGGDAVTGVRLKDGRVIEGDMVIVSAGARPVLGLAKDAGLKTDRGLIVDGSLRTSDPNIFAVGDVTEFNGKTWGIIPVALDQARIAAKKITGQQSPDYAGTIPSNTLKVMGFDLTSIGTVRSQHEPPEPGFEEIRATTADGRIYKRFVLKGNKMIGAVLLGTKKEALRVSNIIKTGEPVDKLKEKLSDPAFAFA